MEERPYEHVKVTVEGAVCTIAIDRPDRKNAIGPRTVNELLYAVDDARDDPAIRVLVLTGAGAVFSAGGDLQSMAMGDLPPRGDYADLLLRFRSLGKPTIARVNGLALGGGLGIVASCDLAVAAESAVLGTPEVRRGLWPMMIMAVLARVMSRRSLLTLMLLGETLSAARAAELELVTETVPDDHLDARVGELATALAAQSPTALRLGLAAYHRMADMRLEEAVPYLRDQLYAMLGTEDAQEGLRAFRERRPPVWTGR